MDRTRPITKPKVYTCIDLFFADVLENLRVPNILPSSLEVPQGDKQSNAYFEVLFAFANANLLDNDVLVFAHADDPDLSLSIHNYAHTKEIYVAKEWFGKNDLDLQSPITPFELVSFFVLIRFHSYPHTFIFFLILLFTFLGDLHVLHQGAHV